MYKILVFLLKYLIQQYWVLLSGYSFMFNADRHLTKQGGAFQVEMDTTAKKEHCFKRNNRNSGAPEAFGDSYGLAR